ncbi:MAG: type II toxin-antitoxin system RelE/ParE family toxin [Actinomycetota bacterium]
MAVTWAPETEQDFRRIFAHNEQKKGEERAIAIEAHILDEGEALRPTSGSGWRGGRPGERRKLIIDEQYWLFFRAIPNGNVAIFAVAATREDWTALVSRR